MILPGISGAYILLILGAYQTVLNLIKMGAAPIRGTVLHGLRSDLATAGEEIRTTTTVINIMIIIVSVTELNN